MTIVRVGRGASVALCVLAGVAFGCGGSGGSAEGDPRPRSPATLEYSANPALYRVGTAVAPNRPATTGGVPTEYRVSPGLPAGLELDVTTGAIAGTPLAPAASRTYTVVAANAGGGASCQLVITVEDAPITGVVLSPLGDDALSGVTVAIAPHGSSSWMQTRTAEDGSFSLAPVGAPYDLAVVSVTDRVARVLEGISRRDVRVELDAPSHRVPVAADVLRQGSIAGVARDCSAGACLPEGYSSVGHVSWLGAGEWTTWLSLPASYDVEAWWPGTDALDAAVVDLWWAQPAPDTFPDRYWLGQVEVIVNAGQTTAAPALSYAPAPAVTVSGRVEHGPGASVDALQLVVGYQPMRVAFVIGGIVSPPAGGTFSVTVPDVPRVQSTVVAQGRSSLGTVALASASAVAGAPVVLGLREPPSVEQPPEGAVISRGDRLAWTSNGADHYEVTIRSSSVDAPIIRINTAALTARVPDLAPLGLVSPPGEYSWVVVARGATPANDALLGDPAVLFDEPRSSWSGGTAAHRFTLR